MSQPNEKETSFVGFLQKLAKKEDRGALAALRRGLGKSPGEAPEMCPYVVPFTQGRGRRQEEAYYLVAALFAWHQGSWQVGPQKNEATDLGASLACLAPPGADNRAGVERRFVALLNCHTGELSSHLRHCVGLLKSKEIPVDWAQLLHDIQGWAWEDRPVQLAWARSFWGQASAESEANATDQQAIPSSEE